MKRSDYINDDLLVKYLLDTTTSTEKASVEKWLNANAENRRYYEHFQLIWKESRQLATASTVDESAAWERFRKRVGADTNTARIIPLTTRKPFPFLRIAAILVVLLGAGTLWFLLGNHETVIKSGQQVVSNTLPDGSSVTLNKDSKLVYASNENSREVSLKGEAFFDVAQDVNKPFVIKVNDVTIRVLGTSFNVKTTKGNTAVIVESGAVEVSKGKEVIQLKQHERAVISTAQKALQKESSDDELYNYYRTNLIVCNKTPLWKLVELFNEVYGVNIVIGDASKRDVPITTTFSVTSLDDNLKIIAETCQLQVTKTDSEILLK